VLVVIDGAEDAVSAYARLLAAPSVPAEGFSPKVVVANVQLDVKSGHVSLLPRPDALSGYSISYKSID
jgi:hypothetical protein